MRVGSKIQVKPCMEGGARDTVTAAVVYIHPKRRYFVVEFQVDGRTIRESFLIRRHQGEK